jgi:hypothetical protein
MIYEIIYIVKIKPFYLNNNVKFKLRLSKVISLELLKFINLSESEVKCLEL